MSMTTEIKRSNFSLFLHELVCAGGASAISKTVVAPLERIKVILQAQHVVTLRESDRFKGFMDALTRIPKEQGIAAFWRGNFANVIRIIPVTAIKFPSYDTFKRTSMPRGEFGYTGIERILRKTEASVFAGIITLIFSYPLDVAKTHLNLDFSKSKEPRKYTGVWNCLKVTRKTYGFAAIYRGLLLASLTQVPYVAVSLLSYDLLREAFIIKPSEAGNTTNSVIKYIGLGTMAGFIAQIATYPLDTMRKRVQVSLGTDRLYKGTLDVFKKTLAMEGVKGFYKGLVPALIKVAPAAAIQFTAYDLLREATAKTSYF